MLHGLMLGMVTSQDIAEIEIFEAVLYHAARSFAREILSPVCGDKVKAKLVS